MVRIPWRGVPQGPVPVKVGDRTVWMRKKEEVMAEQLRVTADGEHIVLVAEGEDGKCEVRLTVAEAERFEEALDKVRKRVELRVEARRSKEAMRVDRVEEDEEDFEESE